MKIETTHLKRCDLVALEGRFDSNTAPDLEKVLRDSMDEGVYQIVLDMESVEFFGSAAIRVLIMAYKECRARGRGDVRLAAVPDRIAQVLDLVGILPLIETFPDKTTAVGSY
ncbi:MAG: STAS domain-containing protein [Chloroflexi bacterium]|nr:STAS domain-containing protein [Chloroflexota bacterium]